MSSNSLFDGTDFKLASCEDPVDERVARECGFTLLSGGICRLLRHRLTHFNIGNKQMDLRNHTHTLRTQYLRWGTSAAFLVSLRAKQWRLYSTDSSKRLLALRNSGLGYSALDIQHLSAISTANQSGFPHFIALAMVKAVTGR